MHGYAEWNKELNAKVGTVCNMPFAISPRSANMRVFGSGLCPASRGPFAATIVSVLFNRTETPEIEGRPIAATFKGHAGGQARIFRFGDDARLELK